jgi:hypothetical protein
MVNKGKSIAKTSKELDIPMKNIRRWLVVGAKRKEG